MVEKAIFEETTEVILDFTVKCFKNNQYFLLLSARQCARILNIYKGKIQELQLHTE